VQVQRIQNCRKYAPSGLTNSAPSTSHI
jgi:hypothetical protein